MAFPGGLMVVVYRKHGLRFAEHWLSESPTKSPGVDVAVHYQCPTTQAGDFSIPFRSLELALGPSVETLLQGLDRDTRYEIRRADSKDGLRYELLDLPSREDLHGFTAAYDAFAQAKGLAPLAPRRLDAQLAAGALWLSRVVHQEQVLTWHAYIVRGRAATLLYSASGRLETEDAALRALTGRANRWLHWQDVLALKAKGCTTYDFGGWYAGTENEQLLRINRFKEGFGGHPVLQCHAYTAHSLLGKVYLQLVRRRYRDKSADVSTKNDLPARVNSKAES